MKIEVCGLRKPGDICAVQGLPIDMIGLVFSKSGQGYASLSPSCSGTLPDYVGRDMSMACSSISKGVGKVGVFGDEMPQNIITMAYNYKLDCIRLDGDETAVMIDNLRSTLDPDICPGIKFIKTIRIESVDDLNECDDYMRSADCLLFDIAKMSCPDSCKVEKLDLLSAYGGKLPFMLKGDFTVADAQMLRSFHHPMFLGVSVDCGSDASSAVFDVESLKMFLAGIKQ